LSQAARAQPDGSAAAQAQSYLIKGVTEAQLGDYEEAILYFETALDRAPENPTLLMALADAHEAQGEYATALFYARQARRHGGARPYYPHRLAELQDAAGEPDAALQTYKDLLDRFPEDTNAYRALATLQAELGRSAAALQTYRTLLKHTSSPSMAVYRRMLALYRRTGNPEGVEETLRALVEQRPNNRSYRRRLGDHLAETEQPDEALDILAPLAAQQPQDRELQRRVEQLSRATGRSSSPDPDATSAPAGASTSRTVDALVKRAESTFSAPTAPDSTRLQTAKGLVREALNQAPSHLSALTLLARIHRETGAPQKAGRALERALEDHPRDPSRWAQAAEDFLHAHDYEKAARLSEEGLLLFPGHYALAKTAAQARLHSGRPKRALEHFRRALDLRSGEAPPSAETAVLKAGLGLAYTLLDRPKDAEAAFASVHGASPTPPAVLRNHAYSLALRNVQLDRALKIARRAVDRAPDHPLSHDTLGWVYFQRDNLAAARRHLRRALENSPPLARILEHAGDVEQALGNDAAAQKYWQQALDRAPDRPSLRKKLDGAATS
jgi:tetratricopeptide (TPR) repeat protein